MVGLAMPIDTVRVTGKLWKADSSSSTKRHTAMFQLFNEIIRYSITRVVHRLMYKAL